MDETKFLSDVAAEIKRARAKFPTSDGIMTALTEEVGELAEALMDKPWDEVWKEAVQVASTAARLATEKDPSLEPTRLRRNADRNRTATGIFQKKPVVVAATQWFKNGDHPLDDSLQPNGEMWEGKVVRYFRHPDLSGNAQCSKCGYIMHDHGWIDTLEDGHNVCPGDWIITGIKGEYYPCKPDIFEDTYKRLD